MFRFGNNFTLEFSLTFTAMFTAKPQKSRAAATAYFDEHLSHNDYYAQNETQVVTGSGRAERLALTFR